MDVFLVVFQLLKDAGKLMVTGIFDRLVPETPNRRLMVATKHKGCGSDSIV